MTPAAEGPLRISINKIEYRTLINLRGLPDGAHMLIMCASSTPTGAILEGSEEAFEELVAFISEELAEGLVRGRTAGTLHALGVKIDPGCADWLGI